MEEGTEMMVLKNTSGQTNMQTLCEGNTEFDIGDHPEEGLYIGS